MIRTFTLALVLYHRNRRQEWCHCTVHTFTLALVSQKQKTRIVTAVRIFTVALVSQTQKTRMMSLHGSYIYLSSSITETEDKSCEAIHKVLHTYSIISENMFVCRKNWPVMLKWLDIHVTGFRWSKHKRWWSVTTAPVISTFEHCCISLFIGSDKIERVSSFKLLGVWH